ncbi:MAG: N-acetylmuramoyl-L-alanine amidase [Bacteroidales bacterium]|nr:N-acetylmuramoyl-L-alanine amidase [Bacteroidales bacterium]
MQEKHHFIKMNVSEFYSWIDVQTVGRTILKIQQHHTYMPALRHFNGNNHFELQRNMRDYHINSNGWSDIGQHFTVFPDGNILTGRSLELSSACIYGNNQNSICIENLGNFDIGGDTMPQSQKDSIVEITAALCLKFNIAININNIIYHHWFRLSDGYRNNGAGGNKSCPGSNFFGGNKVGNCENNFLPLVKKHLSGNQETTKPEILEYAVVTASALNVRLDPGIQFELAKNRGKLQFGAILRVYDKRGAWLKISDTHNHWVSGRYTKKASKYIVNTLKLNVLSGPGINFPKIDQISISEPVFVTEEIRGWAKISQDSRWVMKKYLYKS